MNGEIATWRKAGVMIGTQSIASVITTMTALVGGLDLRGETGAHLLVAIPPGVRGMMMMIAARTTGLIAIEIGTASVTEIVDGIVMTETLPGTGILTVSDDIAMTSTAVQGIRLIRLGTIETEVLVGAGETSKVKNIMTCFYRFDIPWPALVRFL